MPLTGQSPVASWRKRSVYKTEFDRFKQNSDLDLISLASYNEDEPQFIGNYSFCKADTSDEKELIENAKKPRGYIHESKPKAQARNSLISRCSCRSSARSDTSREKECKSASSAYRKPPIPQTKGRCYTSYGARVNKPACPSANVNVNNSKRPATVDSKYTSGRTRTSNITIQQRSKSACSVFGRNNKVTTKSEQPETQQKCLSARELRISSVDRSKIDQPETQQKCLSARELRVSNVDRSSNEVKGAIQPRGLNTRVGNSVCRTDDDDKAVEKEFIIISTHCPSDSNVIEDNVDSKDSGFLSDGVTPEPERKIAEVSEYKSTADTVETKRVTFNLQISGSVDTDTHWENGSNIKDLNDIEGSFGLSDFDGEEEDDDDDETTSYSVLDVNNLIGELQNSRCASPLSNVSNGSRANKSVIDSEINSLCGFGAENRLKEVARLSITGSETEENRGEFTTQTSASTPTFTMSTEARSAILETLQDMRSKAARGNKENDFSNGTHKSVGKQRRIKDNRHKYDQYMREKTNIVDSRMIPQYYQYETTTALNDVGSSLVSNDVNTKHHDDMSTDDVPKGQLFPSIGGKKKRSKKSAGSNDKQTVFSLEQARKKKYKIPGIGNYDLVMSPENTFEITPPGFDSRYNVGTGIPKEELEPPPPLIRERSIQKCKKWLKNISLSPLSLNPAMKQGKQ